MEALKEQYYQTAIKNMWKIKEFQVLNNLRGLRQLSQFEYEEKISLNPDIYEIKMRHLTDEDDVKIIIEIAGLIDKNMDAEHISQIFGIWSADIKKHLSAQ